MHATLFTLSDIGLTITRSRKLQNTPQILMRIA